MSTQEGTVGRAEWGDPRSPAGRSDPQQTRKDYPPPDVPATVSWQRPTIDCSHIGGSLEDAASHIRPLALDWASVPVSR